MNNIIIGNSTENSKYTNYTPESHTHEREREREREREKFLLFVEIIDSLNVSKDELLLSLEGVWEGGTLKLRDEGGDAFG